MVSRKQQNTYLKITDLLSAEQFESIKCFILEHGDRKTYRNIDNNNPHYRLKNADLYLNPERNRNFESTEAVPDFNELVIYDPHNDIQYFTIRIVRSDTEQRNETRMFPELTPGNTYLHNVYNEDINNMKAALLDRYLEGVLSLPAGNNKTCKDTTASEN